MSRFDLGFNFNDNNILTTDKIKGSLDLNLFTKKVYVRLGRDAFSNVAGGLGLIWEGICIDTLLIIPIQPLKSAITI